MIKRNSFSMTALAAAGLLTAALVLGHPDTSRAQVQPPPPGAPVPPPPGSEAAQPVDPKAAPTAIKTAGDALAGLTTGQVWTRTAPRGEQEAQASLVYNGKVVARLNFDPASGLLRARGEGVPRPPANVRGPGAPGAPVPPPGGPVPPPPGAVGAVPPAPTASAPAPDGAAPVPPLPDTNALAPAAPVNIDQIKSKLPDTVKGLSIGQGAEIMPREGFWKVPIISQNRMVGELHISGDGTKVMEDFMAARDAAIFAR